MKEQTKLNIKIVLGILVLIIIAIMIITIPSKEKLNDRKFYYNVDFEDNRTLDDLNCDELGRYYYAGQECLEVNYFLFLTNGCGRWKYPTPKGHIRYKNSDILIELLKKDCIKDLYG